MQPHNIQTQDGSITRYAAQYDEHYHSSAGAWLEACTIYCNGCQLAEKARLQSHISLLDVGFGLGYNSLAAIYTCRSINPDIHIRLVALEADPQTLSFEKYPQIDDPAFQKSITAFQQFKKDHSRATENDDWQLRIGDARATLLTVSGPFDAVFHDPFSPDKNPELWTLDFFKLLQERIAPRGILSTYSIATPVRSALHRAGFKLSEGPGTARKRASTRACIDGSLPALHQLQQSKLLTSPYAVPFRDPQLNAAREAIIEIRREAMETLQK